MGLRTASTRRRYVVAFVFVLVVAACTAPTARGTLAPTTTVAGPENLRMVLFDQFPSTYMEERVGFDLEGPLDLAGAAKADSSNAAAAQALLQRSGFQRGYQRAWSIKGTKTSAVNLVLLFASPQQAFNYFSEITFADSSAKSLTKFSAEPITHSAGFTLTFTNANGPHVTQFVDLVRGPLFYHLSLGGPPGSVQPSEIVKIAISQRDEAASLGYS